jgi:hypothetical protein
VLTLPAATSVPSLNTTYTQSSVHAAARPGDKYCTMCCFVVRIQAGCLQERVLTLAAAAGITAGHSPALPEGTGLATGQRQHPQHWLSAVCYNWHCQEGAHAAVMVLLLPILQQ